MQELETLAESEEAEWGGKLVEIAALILVPPSGVRIITEAISPYFKLGFISGGTSVLIFESRRIIFASLPLRINNLCCQEIDPVPINVVKIFSLIYIRVFSEYYHTCFKLMVIRHD